MSAPGTIQLPAANEAWRTRRRGNYLAAIQKLQYSIARQDVMYLLCLVSIICDHLGQFVPEGTVCAPYVWGRNAFGEPSPTLDGVPLNPSLREVLPQADLILQLSRDLRGEWLDRLAQAVGFGDRTGFLGSPEERR